MRKIGIVALYLLAICGFARAADVENPLRYVSATWTPTLVGSTGGSWTLSTAVGSYELIGRQYTVRFTITASASSSPTGKIQIGGLPAANNGTASDNGICTLVFQTGLTNTVLFTSFAATIAASASAAIINESGSAQTTRNVDVTQVSATPTIVGMCNYHI